jgi:ribosomal protein S12 methylthiotransferase
MKNKSFYLVSLGCAKNTVDSSAMAQILERDGFRSASSPLDAEVLIVNTCGFIEQAREESIDILRELASQKKAGQKLIAAGCFSQRDSSSLLSQVPEVDGVIGTRRWMDILEVIRSIRQTDHPEPIYHLPEVDTIGKNPEGILSTHQQGTSSYLKIADGCRRPCAFCAIPLIKGTAVSRSRDEIIFDARSLQNTGVREINLIAQDTTDYGSDLGQKDGLSDLLEDLIRAVPDVDWIRILYAYPGFISDRLIAVMAENTQILPYIDLPLQHGDPEVLRRMKRPSNLGWVFKTIEKLRKAMPDLALRSTFIVGFPGESDAEFQRLLSFVEEIQFDRLGVFTYSFEPGTAAEPLGDPVPESVKVARKEELMVLQQSISLSRNQKLIGKKLDVLVEGQGEVEGSSDIISVGRSYRDAPEIDGMVIIDGQLPVGEIVPVEINGAMVYDLTAVPAVNYI